MNFSRTDDKVSFKIAPIDAILIELVATPKYTADLIRKLTREHGGGAILNCIADQIDAQTKPRKPAEPNGVGAVIEDSRGDHWVRLGYGPAAWIFAASSPGNRDTYSYSSIDAVRVLAEGVPA